MALNAHVIIVVKRITPVKHSKKAESEENGTYERKLLSGSGPRNSDEIGLGYPRKCAVDDDNGEVLILGMTSFCSSESRRFLCCIDVVAIKCIWME